MANDSPIFLVGAARSGTTLLQYMLRSHPNLSGPTGESHFLVPMYRDQAAYGDLKNPANVRRALQTMHRISTEFMETDLHGLKFDLDALAKQLAQAGDGSMVGLFEALYRANANGEGKRRWIDKTPYYILHLPTILEMFPQAQIVHIVRDGRDCAYSMLQRSTDLGIYNYHHAAKTWQQYVEAGDRMREHLAPTQFYELRYEDVLANGRETMEALCEFLGEPFDDSVVNFKKSQDAVGAERTPLLKQPLQAGNAEKWRKQLSPWQIRVVEAAAGDTLQRHGYPLATEGKRLSLPLRAAYRLHEKYRRARRNRARKN
ncbi:MAG: sulfotransferase [Chromatiales bacterium]|nr:sulfotransferase [Chromatiales bacterium]